MYEGKIFLSDEKLIGPFYISSRCRRNLQRRVASEPVGDFPRHLTHMNSRGETKKTQTVCDSESEVDRKPLQPWPNISAAARLPPSGELRASPCSYLLRRNGCRRSLPSFPPRGRTHTSSCCVVRFLALWFVGLFFLAASRFEAQQAELMTPDMLHLA